MTRVVLFWKRVRVAFSVVAYLTAIMTAGAIDLSWHLFRAWLADEPGCKRRAWFVRWHRRWMETWLLIATRLGGIRIRYVVDASCRGALGPFIVVANHYGAFDGVIAYGALKQFALHDLRPVAAHYARRIPVIGRAWGELGIAFVSRQRRGANLDAVCALAAVAEEDHANVIIFPPGKVLTRKLAGDGPRTLLRARPQGFRQLVEALPHYAVLSLTIYWRDYAPYRLSDEGLVPPGADLVVECHVLPPPIADATMALAKEWERKAAWLRGMQ